MAPFMNADYCPIPKKLYYQLVQDFIGISTVEKIYNNKLPTLIRVVDDHLTLLANQHIVDSNFLHECEVVENLMSNIDIPEFQQLLDGVMEISIIKQMKYYYVKFLDMHQFQKDVDERITIISKKDWMNLYYNMFGKRNAEAYYVLCLKELYQISDALEDLVPSLKKSGECLYDILNEGLLF